MTPALNTEQLNTTALAYLGDSVWELYVREHLINAGLTHVDNLHKRAVNYVSAAAQEKMLKNLMQNFLTEDELTLVKRARNHKLTSSKKNSGKDAMTDKYATAFEALIGYMYLSDDKARLEAVIKKAFAVVENS